MSSHASSPWSRHPEPQSPPPSSSRSRLRATGAAGGVGARDAEGARGAEAERDAVVINGRYQLIRESMRTEAGVVYDATDRTLNRRVAVEIASSLVEPKAQRKWARDGMLAQRLEGVHVLRVLEVGAMADGVPFVVREPAVCTLAAEVEARGAMPVEQAVAWTLDACEAIAEAHVLGMAHGDLRLDNVVLARGESALVLKVGWTSAAKAERAAREDVARDIAGLGAMLKVLVTGHLGDDSQGAATLPNDLAHVVARALAQGAGGGFPNVAELARALAPSAPAGHTGARTVAFLLSRAGIVGSEIPVSVKPVAAASASDRASLTDTWFSRGRAARTSLADGLVAPAAASNRGWGFAIVSIALVMAVLGSSWFLWQHGRLPRWTGAAPPEDTATTQVTSAPGAGLVEPPRAENAEANAEANAKAKANEEAKVRAVKATAVEALPDAPKAATAKPRSQYVAPSDTAAATEATTAPESAPAATMAPEPVAPAPQPAPTEQPGF